LPLSLTPHLPSALARTLTTNRSGEGRGDSTGKNLYENFAETGASAIFPISEKILNLADHTKDMENEAKEEEAKDKEIQAEIVRKTSLKKRMGMTGMSSGSPTDGSGKKDAPPPRAGERQLSGVAEEGAEEEVLADDGTGAGEKVRTDGVDMDARGRASESFLPCSLMYMAFGGC
jgi:6-phosphofructo-2-kinase/fructose-2,6-biphosphatase 4